MNRKIKLLIVLFSICLLLFFYSVYHIVIWQKDNIYTSKIVDNIKIISKSEVTEEDGINFNRLLLENKEVVGWIKVKGTNIDYPVVKHNDNDYYLNHSFDQSYNEAGWIFMDYRNSIQNLDFNTIIYGHGRRDGSMFGSLMNVLKREWINNNDNLVINFETLNYGYSFQIFSIYYIDTTDDYTEINYDEKLLNKLIDRSIYKFDIDIKNINKILTLSTCYNNDKKLVVHAMLMKD